MQFESIANFGAVIDRLGEFQEVLESSAMSRATGTDVVEGDVVPSGQQSLIQLVDKPGAHPALGKNESSVSTADVSGPPRQMVNKWEYLHLTCTSSSARSCRRELD